MTFGKLFDLEHVTPLQFIANLLTAFGVYERNSKYDKTDYDMYLVVNFAFATSGAPLKCLDYWLEDGYSKSIDGQLILDLLKDDVISFMGHPLNLAYFEEVAQ